MTDINSIDYYRLREARELALAQHAASPMVADIHRDMARRYAELIVLGSLTPDMQMASAPRQYASL